MKILIITQKLDINDDILGFFHHWIEEFAKQAEKIVVIAQSVGEHHLPRNFEIFSLGKEKGYSKIRQLFNFYRLLFKNLPKINAVFVHMIPLWVVLGWPLYKIYRKKVYLWYVHKSVNLMLKLAEKIIDKIFTASKESFRLPSKKVAITGHGIDTEKFKSQNSRPTSPADEVAGGRANLKSNRKFRIITAGRIAPVKNYEILIKTAEILKNRGFDFEIKIAGSPILEKDENYFEKLKGIIKEKKLENIITFVGSMPYRSIPEFYQNRDLFVNFSDTGSLDKAVLEAMAAGLLVLTSNEAFKNILADKYFTDKNPKEVAEKIISLSKFGSDPSLSDYVIKNHGLEPLVKKIINLVK